MAVASSAKAITAAGLWKLGVTSAGRSIVDAAVNGDEDTSTVAGILLTRASDRAVPLIADSLAEQPASPILIDILASIGTDSALSELRRHTDATDPETARTATDAVKRMEKRRGGNR